MNLRDILYPDLVFCNLEASNKIGVIHELAEKINNVVQLADKVEIGEVLLNRERLGSTGIGEGVAIPHGKLPGISSLIGCFGRSLKGIEYDSVDDKKVHLFFVFLVPVKVKQETHIKLLGRCARVFNNADFRERIFNAEDRTEVLVAIEEAEKNLRI